MHFISSIVMFLSFLPTIFFSFNAIQRPSTSTDNLVLYAHFLFSFPNTPSLTKKAPKLNIVLLLHPNTLMDYQEGHPA